MRSGCGLREAGFGLIFCRWVVMFGNGLNSSCRFLQQWNGLIMSNVNIKRAVDNIRANTTIYTPVIEVIVNAIQAIEETGRADGKIIIRVQRNGQMQTDGSLPEISSFEIEDNGIGFTEAHRDSFDTLYTDKKIKDGGKGFGRFTCLKYFKNLHVRSVFQDGDVFNERRFSMGEDKDIIVNEKIEPSQRQESGTVVSLLTLREGKEFEKRLATIARNLVERLLPYFITKDYVCPEIILTEVDEKSICLNDYVRKNVSSELSEIETKRNVFTLKASGAEEEFSVRVFKLYSPKNQRSKISLVAHKREVSVEALHKYIPEFEDEFYEKEQDGEVIKKRNYIIKAYVFGSYLDHNVSLERGGFEFGMEPSLLFGIGQVQVEREASAIAKEAVGSDIISRQEKKKEKVYSYVDNEAPWHKNILETIDLSGMPYNPSNEDIELRLQKEKFTQEIKIKKDVAQLLKESDLEKVKEQAGAIVSKISETGKNDLIHYIAHRRNILDIFSKSLQIDENGKYSSEGTVHDIIFPRKGSTEITSFKDHNLWILDERLNFTTYVSSDIPLDGKNTERPDVVVYNKRVVFRGDNEASNPITIFEFKKPQRDDFVNPSSQEDPVQQIIRYVNNIRDGKYKTPEGLKIMVSENTPFYGYVVCELSQKVELWLEREKDFKPMPDRLGWFRPMSNINLYVEVISWDKVLRDATMRNKIFFKKLGIL
uniref:ATP-binding protein n=1 Tax=Candidatus Electronema sp. TaxID=2698783 RepID=UPI004055CCC0